jgi:hypothetical protein
VLFFALVFLLAAGIRLLTYNFMRAHLDDAAWFQHGSYGVFDEKARSILDGTGRLFWIDDPARTDLAQYPPAYPWLVATVYRVTGNHSAYSLQTVQSIFDLVLCMVLVTGVAVTAYGWPTAMAASVMAALSPLLAIVGVSPSADAPTTWFVVGGLWLLLIAAKGQRWWWALGAGLLLGIACWIRVNPLYLCLFWAAALMIFVGASWRHRLLLGAAVALATILVISPIVIRNYLVFPDFSPTGGTIGANLWEGLGETELGRANGFLFGDDKMVERERIMKGLPADAPFAAMRPDDQARPRTGARIARVHQATPGLVRGCDATSNVGNVEDGRRAASLLRYFRHQRDPQQVPAAKPARRCAGRIS